MKLTQWYLLVTSLFITCLLTANIIAGKIADFGGGLFLPAAVIVFPLSYIFGDVLTEVYGFRQARLTIWLGFLCNLVMVGFFWLGGLLPSAPFWADQSAYTAILGATPRILGASFAAYLVGELANSVVLAQMKVATRGRWLWLRTIGSTIVGEGLDSLVFITLAFAGTPAGADLVGLIVRQWLFKTVYEVLATPLTYAVIGFLKRAEGLDVYDTDTVFNPLPIAR